ncbi:MAG TPA: MYXO-CTERM sorting domain-containing protein [Acetobacteraceae bacterium]|nr:MYXO-CTERM sorting domain-containing protein [Acetobacteraceae bacterium]
MRPLDAIRGVRGLIVALAFCALAAHPASATLYTWTLSGGGGSGSGSLTTGAADYGGFDITAFSGQLDGVPVAGLLGGQPGGGEGYSPSGAFIYDNMLYPSSNSTEGALLDNGGILFAIAGGEGNIWGNFRGPGGYSYYTSVSGNYLIQNNAASFTIADPPSSVPEPSPAGLVALGVVGLGLTRRRRGSARRNTVAASQ